MVRLSTRLIMTHNYCMPPIYAASLNTTAEGYFQNSYCYQGLPTTVLTSSKRVKEVERLLIEVVYLRALQWKTGNHRQRNGTQLELYSLQRVIDVDIYFVFVVWLLEREMPSFPKEHSNSSDDFDSINREMCFRNMRMSGVRLCLSNASKAWCKSSLKFRDSWR